jgi:hypothetical protein
MKSGHFVQELYRLSLWPMPDLNGTKSLQDICSRVHDFRNCPKPRPWCNGYSWDVANIDCKELLVKASNEILTRSVGLCLNCVQKGRIMRQDGNCQEQSLELCKNIVG